MGHSKAFKAGQEYGELKGSWVFDGNSEEDAIRRILTGYEDGDPEVMDIEPYPLSGEWSGESMPELSDRFGIDLEDEQKASDFEAGFSDGYWSEVVRIGKHILGI